MSELPAVSLPQYEGPLDLLLDLVRQHRLNILDLPVAKVTRQYLDYIHQAEELNIDLGAEFIFMTATLILIKSRMLLPRNHAEQDPREELVEQLISHEQAKRAGEFLGTRLLETANTWSAPGSIAEFIGFETGVNESQGTSDAEPVARSGNINLLDALRLMQKALAVTRARRALDPPPELVSLEEMVHWVAEQIRRLNGEGFFILTELFRRLGTLEHRTMLFLALLEMARGQQLQLDQEECFGPIRISPRGEK